MNCRRIDQDIKGGVITCAYCHALLSDGQPHASGCGLNVLMSLGWSSPDEVEELLKKARAEAAEEAEVIPHPYSKTVRDRAHKILERAEVDLPRTAGFLERSAYYHAIMLLDCIKALEDEKRKRDYPWLSWEPRKQDPP